MGIRKLRDQIIDQELCSGCGVCVGICPAGAIQIKEPFSDHPDSFNMEACTECGLCTSVCPGLGYEVYQQSEKEQIFNKDIGYYRRFYSGFSLDKELRESASAGGVATEILKYLIENNDVDKVSVVQNTDNLSKGTIAYPELTGSIDEVSRARQSKYVQVPLGTLLKEIINSDERVALVGLPCQLAAIRRAEDKVKSLKSKIVFKVGFFCGYSYTPSCINGILGVMGLDKEEVKRIVGWRHGGIPGSFTVELIDGSTRRIPFIEEHCINVPFYSLLRCHLCADWSAVYSDLSLGDIGGWARKNMIISRTANGEELLQEMQQAGRIQLERLSEEVAWKKTTLPSMNAVKKERGQLFISYLKRRGWSTPKWNLEFHNNTVTTKLYSRSYFGRLMEARREVKLYEQNPQLMLQKGRYIYQDFWRRFPFRAMRKGEKILLQGLSSFVKSLQNNG